MRLMCRAHLPSIIFALLPVTPHSCQPLRAPTSHSTLPPVTPHSCLPLHIPTKHSRSHQSLHNHSMFASVTPRSHQSLPPASPLSHLHAHRRYPHVHIEVQPELGTRIAGVLTLTLKPSRNWARALATTGFRRYKAFWRTSSRMFPSSSL